MAGWMGKKEKRVGERMEEGELWTEGTREWKERRREKGVGWGGGSGQRKGDGEGKMHAGRLGGNCVVRREMGNVKQEGGGK
jgi:hypothetical protein